MPSANSDISAMSGRIHIQQKHELGVRASLLIFQNIFSLFFGFVNKAKGSFCWAIIPKE